MALSTYAELQTAIRDELGISTSGLTDTAIIDAINRAESRINRKLRLREMEQLATATLATGEQYLALPERFVENISVHYKLASQSDYRLCKYVAPALLDQYDGSVLRYTLRDQFEFAPAPTANNTIRMHYLRRWDLATDGSNWLLTTHPDVYFYGALSELERTLRNDLRMETWRMDFQAAMAELNEVAERGRDDAQLLTDEVGRMANASRFNILAG